MSRFQNLVKLAVASISVDTDFKDTKSPLAGKFAGALAEAREKQALVAMQAAAEEVLLILTKTEEARENHRQVIRNQKALIEAQVQRLNDLDRALAFAEETENFLPLIGILEGFVSAPLGSKVITKVPDTWVPANGKKVPPAPKKAVLKPLHKKR